MLRFAFGHSVSRRVIRAACISRGQSQLAAKWNAPRTAAVFVGFQSCFPSFVGLSALRDGSFYRDARLGRRRQIARRPGGVIDWTATVRKRFVTPPAAIESTPSRCVTRAPERRRLYSESTVISLTPEPFCSSSNKIIIVQTITRPFPVARYSPTRYTTRRTPDIPNLTGKRKK